MAEAALKDPPDGDFTKRAKAWSAVAFGILAVLALALWLFSYYQAKRKIDLQQQFARSAARLSKQVELRYENDRQIIDNVTRLLASAETLATDQRRDLLNKARRAVEMKKEWTEAALVRAYAAKYLSTTIGITRSANPDTKFDSRFKDAATAATAWLEAANVAQLAERAVPATELRDAEDAVAEKASTAGALQVKVTEKASELDAARPDEVDAKKGELADRVRQLDAARKALVQVEKARSTVQATIVALQLREHEAYKSEWLARRKALDAWHQVQALPDLNAVAAPNSTPEDKVLSDAFQEVEKNLASDVEADVVVADPLTKSDPAANGREEARTFRARLKGVVLPSYRESLDECPSNVGLRALALCAARKISDLSAGTAAGVEVVECPVATDASKPASNLMSGSGDGQYLLLPGADADRAPLRICGRVRIDQLLATSSHKQSLVKLPQFAPFDAVALLRTDGTALYVPEADSNVRLSSLALEKGKFSTSSMVEKIALGGGEYRAFIQPVKIAVDAGGAMANLVVAGFISESTLTKQSMEIELSSYLWVVLLLGVGVLSLPLGKLWLLGENARFTNFDVTLLATSALLITLLAVVLLEGFVAHNRLWFRAGGQIKEVAERIETKLSTKIKNVGNGLDAFVGAKPTHALASKLTTLTDSSAQYRLSNECELNNAKSVDNVLFTGDFNRWSVCELTRFRDIHVRGGWNVAFLANSLGYQQAKFVPSDHASTPLSIASRGYFKGALHESAGCIDPDCVARGAAEVVRSAASGDLVLIAAKRVVVDGTQTGIAGIETSLDEFRELVLPLGFRAAVIDREGTVMLHSEDDNAHGQSLFADLDDPTSLRAALATQTPSLLEVRYLGVPSRAYVQPLALRGLGWSVLVFAPFNVVDVATTDMVLTTLLGFGGLLALVVVLTCVGLLLVRVGWICGIGTPPVAEGRHSISFRPRGSYSEAYAAAGVWMVRWSALLCAVAWLSEGWVPTTALLAGNAIVAGWALLRIPGFGLIMPVALGRFIDRAYARLATRARSNKEWRTNTALSYTLCCVGLAAVFVVTPSTIAFAGSYDLVVETLVRAEQSHIAGEVGPHPESLMPDLPCVKPTTNAAALTTVVPRDEAYCPKRKPAVPKGLWCSLWPIPCLADYLPPLGCAETQTWGRLYRSILHPPEPPQAGDYDFRRSRSDLQVVWNADNTAVSAVRLPTLRSLAFNWPKLIMLLFAFAVFLTVALATGYRSLSRLFFLDLLGKKDLFWPMLLNSPGQKALVTFADASLETALRKHGFVELPKDPMVPSPPKCMVPALERWLPEEGLATRVALAAQTQATVVLLSNADPMRRVSDTLRKQWATALAGYEVLMHSCPSQPPPDANIASMTQTWLDCDPREQQVLAYLVLDGYANPHANTKTTIEHLVRRGILDCDSLTVANPKFEAVIRHSVTGEQRRAWATSNTGSAWQAVRVPLSGAVVALFSAVTMSKPELGAATAVVPTLAASLPAIIRTLLETVSPKAG